LQHSSSSFFKISSSLLLKAEYGRMYESIRFLQLLKVFRQSDEFHKCLTTSCKDPNKAFSTQIYKQIS